jgi:phosphatidylserine/phosphatidylglycerophosphate/cardiolipin synthase-like enzyme
MNLWKLLPLTFLLLACQTPPAPTDAAPPEAGLLDVAPPSPPVLIVPAASTDGTWSVHFSPNGCCEDAVVQFIGNAKESVHLLAYGFTSEKIANALISKKAMNRLPDGGVLDVVVVLDKSDKTAKGSMASLLKNGNVPVFIDSKHAIMHDKVIIIDGRAFETGSFNFTNAAEHNNAENCFIEYDKVKAGVYEDNFQVHLKHSDVLPFSN